MYWQEVCPNVLMEARCIKQVNHLIDEGFNHFKDTSDQHVQMSIVHYIITSHSVFDGLIRNLILTSSYSYIINS